MQGSCVLSLFTEHFTPTHLNNSLHLMETLKRARVSRLISRAASLQPLCYASVLGPSCLTRVHARLFAAAAGGAAGPGAHMGLLPDPGDISDLSDLSSGSGSGTDSDGSESSSSGSDGERKRRRKEGGGGGGKKRKRDKEGRDKEKRKSKDKRRRKEKEGKERKEKKVGVRCGVVWSVPMPWCGVFLCQHHGWPGQQPYLRLGPPAEPSE